MHLVKETDHENKKLTRKDLVLRFDDLNFFYVCILLVFE